MHIPKHKVEEIYNRLDILEVISDYVQLKRKGHYYVGLSPFKEEKSPSFTVTPSKGIFKDFSTGIGGNAVTFLMELEGLTYPEALLKIAHKYQIEVEIEQADATFTQNQHAESLKILNKFACEHFYKNLVQYENGDNIAKGYLLKRGFNDAVINTFQLGYCLPNWTDLTDAAIKKGFKSSYLIETGLSIVSEKNNKLYDRFNGRLIFPIHDVNGKIIGFSARILDKNDKGAKYVNSPESVAYSKGKVLFGLYFAKQSIRELDECILVEGNADVVSLYQAGIKNTVASSGTALTSDQITLIKRYTENILLIFDGDKAGINAALRGIDLLLGADMSVRVLHLPDNHDPDSYVHTFGANAFREYAKNNAMDFITFKKNVLTAKYSFDDPAQRAQIINEIAESLSKISDNLKRTLYIQSGANQLKIDEQLMLSVVNKFLHQAQIEEQKTQNRLQAKNQSATSHQVSPLAHPADQSENNYINSEPPPFDFDVEYPADLNQSWDGNDSYQTPPQKTEPNTLYYPTHGHDSNYYIEREFLRLMLNYPKRILYEWTDDDLPSDEILMYEFLYQEIGEESFKNPVFQKIKQALFNAYVEQKPFPINELLTEYDSEVRMVVSDLMTQKYNLSPKWIEKDLSVPKMDYDLYDSVLSGLRHYKLKRFNELIIECQRLIQQFQSAPDTPFSVFEKLMKRKMKLESDRKEITDILGVVVLKVK